MRRLVPAVLVSALVLAACGEGDDATSDSAPATSTPSTADVTTTTIDPDECFEVPSAATVTTTTPPTTAAPVAGPTVPPATTAPAATTVPPTTVPDTAPGTATPGVEPADYPADEQPRAIRPCTLPTALQITVLRPGSGRPAAAGDQLFMDYFGVRSEDGTVFDESYSRGEPLNFKLGQGNVIPGWDQGLMGAQDGALIRLDIPAELAYGDQPSGEIIQPGDALTFITEVRLVVKATTSADAPLDVTVPSSEGATEVTTQDLVVGTGPELQSGQTAVIHAMLVRGDNLVVLTNTWSTNSPTQIQLVEGGVNLPGLVEGLLGANVGTRRVITMPPEDAFGEAGAPQQGLPAGTDLIVIVEVIGVLGEPAE
jgi:FKBP-type peptidyl-prolyl cis-trans isomerase